MTETEQQNAANSPWRDKKGIAARYGKSIRLITNWQRKRVIPFVKQGRNVLFDIRKTDRALEKFEFRSVGTLDRAFRE